jgi:hypothetical protein
MTGIPASTDGSIYAESVVVHAGSGKLDSWDRWNFCLTAA